MPKQKVITEFQDGMRCFYSDIEAMLREANKNSTLPTRHQMQEMNTQPKLQVKPVKKEKKPDYEVRFTMKGLDQKIGCKDKLEVVNHVQVMRKKYGDKLKIELFFKGKSVGTL